jgi:hypothetical protein
MKKKKFKKLVKRENRSFGIVTETIMMNELKKLNENEWRYWLFSVDDVIKDEDFKKEFEMKGIVGYSFELKKEFTYAQLFYPLSQWRSGNIMFDNKYKLEYWDYVNELQFEFWAKLIEGKFNLERILKEEFNFLF